MTSDNGMAQKPTAFQRVKFKLFHTRCRLYSGLMVLLAMALFLSLSGRQSVSAAASRETGRDRGCPVNTVRVGPLCMDKYEASVWSEPPTSDGRPRGSRFGLSGDDYPCSFNGDDCSGANPIYAAPVPGRRPSAYITWFQAQQACLNVGKRLPTNAEWQGAAAGTPTDYEPNADDGLNDCNTSTAGQVVSAGSRKSCVSNFGAADMVGNLVEWTADWTQGSNVPFAPPDGTAGPDFGDDFMVGINPTKHQGSGTNFPSVFARGGGFNAGSFSTNGAGAGVFAVNAHFSPSVSAEDIGFRCVQ